MPNMIAPGNRSWLLAILLVVAAACERDQPVSPQKNEPAAESPYSAVADSCQLTCSIVSNPIPLRVAATATDTAGLTVELASFEIAGVRGSTVSLSVEIDTNIFSHSFRETHAVLVTS